MVYFCVWPNGLHVARSPQRHTFARRRLSAFIFFWNFLNEINSLFLFRLFQHVRPLRTNFIIQFYSTYYRFASRSFEQLVHWTLNARKKLIWPKHDSQFAGSWQNVGERMEWKKKRRWISSRISVHCWRVFFSSSGETTKPIDKRERNWYHATPSPSVLWFELINMVQAKRTISSRSKEKSQKPKKREETERKRYDCNL